MSRMHCLSRRELIRGLVAGSAAAPYAITSSALGGEGKAPASERVALGHIGLGARGQHIVPWFGPEAQSAAFCDPFRSRREAVAKRYGGTPYADLREMLARDDLDAAVVETTDHWHVPATVLAANAGKDVYCEKPFGLCLGWSLAARDAIKRTGRVFQYGTQALSYGNVRLCAELVRSGRIGEVREILVSTGGGQSGGLSKPLPVPDDLDYDLWLGAAPWRPYCGQPLTQDGWIYFYDYSVGWVGGMGSHPLAAAELGFDSHLAGPFQIEAKGVIPRDGFRDTLVAWDACIEFANGVRMLFRNGPTLTRFIGTEGWLEPPNVDYVVSGGQGGGIGASRASLLATRSSVGEGRLGRARGNHGEEFIQAVKTRTPATVGIDIALRSDAILHLTDIAVRTGRKLTWDPVKEQLIGDPSAALGAGPEAARLLHRPLREPWRL